MLTILADSSYLTSYLTLSVFMFTCGLGTVILKRNTLAVLMGIELMLNAANINFIAFAYNRPTFDAGMVDLTGHPMLGVDLNGHMLAMFVIILAAAEAAVGLAIVVNYVNRFKTIDINQADTLKG